MKKEFHKEQTVKTVRQIATTTANVLRRCRDNQSNGNNNSNKNNNKEYKSNEKKKTVATQQEQQIEKALFDG